MSPLSALGPTALNAPANSNSPEKIKGAAQQFESLMISELLKTARGEGDGSGWMGTGDEDQAGQTGLDMAEQQLANVMSKAGGLGMQKFIMQGLVRKP